MPNEGIQGDEWATYVPLDRWQQLSTVMDARYTGGAYLAIHRAHIPRYHGLHVAGPVDPRSTGKVSVSDLRDTLRCGAPIQVCKITRGGTSMRWSARFAAMAVGVVAALAAPGVANAHKGDWIRNCVAHGRCFGAVGEHVAPAANTNRETSTDHTFISSWKAQ